MPEQSSQPKRAARRRIAHGARRPRYLDTPEMDKMMIMFMALITEVFALRDRVDTHEVLLEQDGKLSKSAIEAFTPSPAIDDSREQQRLASMRRIFRVLRDELEGKDAEEGAAS